MQLESNLTGFQVQLCLDTLLYTGIEALFAQTRFIEPHIVGMFSWVIRNNRKRISRLDHKRPDFKQVQISCLANILNSDDPEEQLRYYMGFKPDRYISFGLLELFLTAVEDYQTTEDVAKQRSIERAVGGDPDTLWAVITHVRDCLDMAYEFRNGMVEKFVDLCHKDAWRQKNSAIIPISAADLSQNLTRAVIIALDKYNYQKGALTSYIRTWMRYLSQSPDFSHERGLAYDIPHNYRSRIGAVGQSNIGSDLDDAMQAATLTRSHASVHEEVEDEEGEKLILRLMQLADPKGIIRLSLGVDEVLSPKHTRRMKRQMRSEAGTVKVSRSTKRAVDKHTRHHTVHGE